MSRSIEITLALPKVLPILGVLRAEAAAFESDPETAPDILRTATSVAEVRELLGLFDAGFEKSGRITVDGRRCLALLRGMAALKWRLRRGPLSDLADVTFENDVLPEDQPESLRPSLMAHEFLENIQNVLLQNHVVPEMAENPVSRFIRTLPARLRRNSSHSGGTDKNRRIILRNDAVNTMSYVAAALHHELDLSGQEARRHVARIHEQGNCPVWSGPPEQAERHARALRSWHLLATVEPL